MKMNVIIFGFCALATISCKDNFDFPIPRGSHEVDEIELMVETKKVDDKWRLLVNGEELYINGAATNNYYGKVKEFGGNTIRTYGVSAGTAAILEEARENGLWVNFGMYAKRETDGFDYNNETAVAEQLELFRQQVKLYKNDPSILMWSVANESESAYTNTKLWNALGDIVDMIHEEDPKRPVTLALASANENHVAHILDKVPNLDILSINVYAPSLPTTVAKLQAAGWDKPLMITEYGPRGTWQMNPEPTRIMPWISTGSNYALVEQTSTEKAAVYKSCFDDYIWTERDNAVIGSFVFVWGYQTHGEVLNWYGLFDKKGYAYGGAEEMRKCWTGSYAANRVPVIATRADMTLNGKVAEDKIYLQPNSVGHTAKVVATDPDGDPLTYEWIIFKEGDKSADGSLPDGIAGLIEDNTKSEITFKVPTAGAYRLYVFVRDEVSKGVASACIPFCAQ